MDTLVKADLFEPKEHGYCLMDSPSTWRHYDAITAHLDKRGDSLTAEDLTQKNKDGKMWLQRGVECFVTMPMFTHCMKEDGGMIVAHLVDDQGKATELLNTIIEREQLPALSSPIVWQNNTALEYRRFYQALPQEQKDTIGNYTAVHNQMSQRDKIRGAEGLGRSMVDKFVQRNDPPQGIGL